MRSNDSFYNDKPAYQRESYQATAAKSPQKRRVDQTQQYTPTRFSKKPSDRVSDLKNSINKCIQSMSNKKEMNRQALQQVKDVNREIIQNFSGQGSYRGYKSNRKPSQNYQHPQYRTDYRPRYDTRDDKERQNVTLSSFHLAPQNPARLSNFQTSEVYRPESLNQNQYENQQLRQRVRNQRVQNQNLQRQLQQLQRQNQQLLSQTSNFGFQEDPYQVEQNVRLRNEFERINGVQNISMIYQEFQRLKQDNDKLRRETINLLKRSKY